MLKQGLPGFGLVEIQHSTDKEQKNTWRMVFGLDDLGSDEGIVGTWSDSYQVIRVEIKIQRYYKAC